MSQAKVRIIADGTGKLIFEMPEGRKPKFDVTISEDKLGAILHLPDVTGQGQDDEIEKLHRVLAPSELINGFGNGH